jgi:hypothetical protein
LVLFLTAVFAPAGAAQHGELADELDAAVKITPGEILEHIDVLASDLFQGREAATPGERRAAVYIVAMLKDAGRLQPAGPDGSWFQPFELMRKGEPVEARNILAMLPGNDPDLAHEILVVGAHYDHVGYGRSGNAIDGPGEIHNGADDNASGSATLLDLATSLANSGWKPRRTIMFQWYSGEELGLLGSKHYVEEPVFPLENHAFMLNMDMVGRLTERRLLVGGTGTSEGLAELARGYCEDLGLDMLDDPPGAAPSDNSSFYEKGIPVLFLFTGLHDDYHRVGDDAYKVNARGAADIGRLARRLLEQIDARDERPAFKKSPGTANLFMPRPYVGVTFDVAPAAPNTMARVAVVIPDSPAALAGLVEGDLVVSMDGHAVEGPKSFDHWPSVVEHTFPPTTLVVLRAAGTPVEGGPMSASGLTPIGSVRMEITIQPVVR